MASTVKSGSRGDDVKQLQTLLNQQGYGLSVDGIFGSATQNAVRQYQQASGLSVDGIVGANTWGALLGSGGGGTIGTGGAGSSYYDPSTGQMMGQGWTPGQAGAGGGAVTVPTGSNPSGSAGSAAYSGQTDNPNYTYEQLLQELQRGNGYTPLTEEDILQQAQNRYDPIFNQNKLSAEQQLEKTLLALEQQKAALQPTYDKQREQTSEAFDKARSQADRQSLSRGMQRSSYNNATLANIDTAGAKAQNEIGAEQARAENDIEANKALSGQQVAQYIQQLENDYTTNVAAYQDAIRDKDYDRAREAQEYANQIEMALYELGRQQHEWAVSQEQWERQFAEEQRQYNQSFAESQRQFDASLAASKSGGGGGGSSGSGGGQQVQYGSDPTSGFLNGLYGGTTSGWVNATGWTQAQLDALRNSGASSLPKAIKSPTSTGSTSSQSIASAFANLAANAKKKTAGGSGGTNATASK